MESPTAVSCGTLCAPSALAAKRIDEGLDHPETGVVASASVRAPLLPGDFDITYSIVSQSFFDPSVTACVSTVNDGIFDVHPTSGEILVTRYSAIPGVSGSSLQFEACPPKTDLRYQLTILATSQEHLPGTSVSQSTCTLTLTVNDVNDAPVFPSSYQNRLLVENSRGEYACVSMLWVFLAIRLPRRCAFRGRSRCLR